MTLKRNVSLKQHKVLTLIHHKPDVLVAYADYVISVSKDLYYMSSLVSCLISSHISIVLNLQLNAQHKYEHQQSTNKHRNTNSGFCVFYLV